jgi:DNA-directed RNA polymerase II subunit RPB2
MRKWHI